MSDRSTGTPDRESERIFDLTVEQPRGRRRREVDSYSPDVISAWVADMDSLPAAAIRQAVARAELPGTYVYPNEQLYAEVKRPSVTEWRVNSTGIRILSAP